MRADRSEKVAEEPFDVSLGRLFRFLVQRVDERDELLVLVVDLGDLRADTEF